MLLLPGVPMSDVPRYQCRLLLGTPIAVNPTQLIVGTMSLKANKAKSYDVDIVVRGGGGGSVLNT